MHPRLSFLSLWFIVLYLLYLFICTPKFLQILPRLKKKKKKKRKKGNEKKEKQETNAEKNFNLSDLSN